MFCTCISDQGEFYLLQELNQMVVGEGIHHQIVFSFLCDPE